MGSFMLLPPSLILFESPQHPGHTILGCMIICLLRTQFSLSKRSLPNANIYVSCVFEKQNLLKEKQEEQLRSRIVRWKFSSLSCFPVSAFQCGIAIFLLKILTQSVKPAPHCESWVSHDCPLRSRNATLLPPAPESLSSENAQQRTYRPSNLLPGSRRRTVLLA